MSTTAVVQPIAQRQRTQPLGIDKYVELVDIIQTRHAGPKHPDFKRQRKNKLATNIRKRARRLKQVLGVGMLFSMLAAAGVKPAAAQQLPDAPQATLAAVAAGGGVAAGAVRESKPALPVRQPWLTRSESLDATAMLAANLGDYGTTQRFLRVGGKEGELPTALVSSKPGFLAFKLGETAGEVEAERWIDRTERWQRFDRRHHYIAPAVMHLGAAAVAGMTTRVDVNNWEYAQHVEADARRRK